LLNKSYRVREFAELAGVTVKALHHYDRLGLLKPARTTAGYRVYSAADLARLEQIVALRFLGIPLKKIGGLLERDVLPLRSTFRQQREVLEDKRQLLDRAIQILVEAEQAIDAGMESAGPILQRVIRVMSMQDIDVMKKYYSEEAWAEWKHHYEDWPSQEWQELYRDIAAASGADPAGDAAQALAVRWIELTQTNIPMASIRTGLRKAWADREHWPPGLKRRMAEFDIERATQFVNEALWIKWDAERETQRREGTAAPPRVSESLRALFRDAAAILGADPSSEAAQTVAARWRAIVDASSGGDEETKAEMLKGFRSRKSWPTGLKRYWASTYEMDPDLWEKVTDFIERSAQP
jgi:DNA-binding transcriptional MerR regulator